MRVQATHDRRHRGKVEGPERQVDQVNAQIDDAAAPGLHRVIKPRFVRAISIVKSQFDGVDMTDLAALYQLAHGLYTAQKTIRQIDCQKSVRAPGCGHGLPGFGSRPSQGFLTKHTESGVRTGDGLDRMQGTWCGNHDAIEMRLAEEVVEALAPNRLRR